MYYVSQQNVKSTIPHKAMVSVIVSILMVPPQQRRIEDHEYVFRYFYDNKYLCEIQRTKSLNAKQQCIANLEIDTKKPDPSEKGMIIIDRLLVQIDEDQKQKYYVMINQEKKNQIMSVDQRYLRKNIQILKTYMILKDLKYSQMLHLAFYMEQISFKYKQEVYHQGSPPQFLYLVCIGEFHFCKNVVSQATSSTKNKKYDRPKRYDAKTNNPNRTKNSVSIEMKVGVIQGGSGQCFGQQQIVADKKRQYTVKCMSTQNLLIRIPQSRYKKVIKDSFTKMQWLKKQNQKKLKFKDQIFNKIISIKKNYKQYTQMISKSQFNKTQNLKASKQNIVKRSDQVLNENISSAYLISEKSRITKKRSESIASEDHAQKNYNQTLDKSRVAEQQQKSNYIRNSHQSQQNQDEGTFALTKAEYKRKKKQERHRQNQSLHSPIVTNASNNSLLPSIVSQKYKASSTHQTLDSNVGKNFSASRPIIQLRGLRKKFSGMIDSNSLIKQKEQIFNYKNKMRGENRNEIFPVQISQKRQNNKQNTINLSKQQTRQMRSAVHSKSFMQKLLIQALRKAGYNSQKNSQSYVQENQNSVIDVKTNLRVPKTKLKLQKLSETNLLQKNSFDQCYFKKLD